MSTRGRGKKFAKPKRGGGRSFSRFPPRGGLDEEVPSESFVEENLPSEKNPSDGSEEEESGSEVDEDPFAANKTSHTSLIDVSNPNAPKKNTMKLSDLNNAVETAGESQLSRREREALQKEQARAAYMKATMEGKTEQARADLARLAIIRKQREEAAARKAATAADKVKSKEESLLANKSIISKSLGSNKK